MWVMLTGRATDLKIELVAHEAHDERGSAHWLADYTFTSTGRKVHNDVHAEFTFRDGLIHTHHDRFSFYGWARLGPSLDPLAELSAPAEPPSGPLILCHRDLTPANVRRLNGSGLAVVGWERTAPLPARWELGYVLLQWTGGTDDRADAATAAAILAGYRAAGGAPDPVDRTLFTAAVTAWLNWTFARLAAARTDAGAAAEAEQLRRTPPDARRLDVLLGC